MNALILALLAVSAPPAFAADGEMLLYFKKTLSLEANKSLNEKAIETNFFDEIGNNCRIAISTPANSQREIKAGRKLLLSKVKDGSYYLLTDPETGKAVASLACSGKDDYILDTLNSTLSAVPAEALRKIPVRYEEPEAEDKRAETTAI